MPGRIEARPSPKAAGGDAGLHRLRNALLYVPAGYTPHRAAPLAVMLHGAGGDARQGISLVREHADAAGLIVLAPQSRDETWDLIARRAYSSDVVAIDKLLADVFSAYCIDPAQIACGGFSDGASYALSIGVMNGDLFTHLIAFSPGFLAPQTTQGKPRVFIAHGTHDRVLPVERCGRRVAELMRDADYDVTWREFDGPHTVPPAIAHEAIAWMTGMRPAI
jgi:phospholipase/carboxylesterase